MNDNPYSSLIGIIRKEGAYESYSTVLLGKITKPLPDIEIVAEKMPLYKTDLLIDKWLIDRHNELEDYSYGEHSHSICADGGGSGQGKHTHKSKSYVDKLNVGDTVLLAKFRDEEKLVIISKVVSL